MKTDYTSLRSQVRNFSDFYGAAINDAKKQVRRVTSAWNLSSVCSRTTDPTKTDMPNEELLLSFGRFQQPSVRCLKPTRTSWRNTERRSHCAGSTTSSWWSLKVCREIKESLHAAEEICAINRGVLFLGNIRVLCRVKPVLKEDQHEEGQSVVVTTDSNNESSLSVLNKGKGRIFELDKVFHPQASQEEVRK